MKWKSVILPSLIVILLGGVAGFVVFLYLSQYPALVASSEDAYNVLRDVIMIVIAVVTLFTAVLIAIVGWALRGLLLHDLKSELSEIVEKSENILCSNLHAKIAPLWGRMYEYDKKAIYLIEYAVGEAEQAFNYANKLKEKKYWELHIKASNNYLMALAEKGDTGDANEAYKISANLEKLLTEHEKELGTQNCQKWRETVYFVRYQLPRTKSSDKEQAIQDFYSLKDHPDFGKWKKRWDDFKVIAKETNPDKSS